MEEEGIAMIKDIYNRFKENFYMTFMYSSFLIFIFLKKGLMLILNYLLQIENPGKIELLNLN